MLNGRGESTVTEIATEFPEVGRTAVSAHLRVLRNAELVQERRAGKYRKYSLGPNRAEEVIAFLREVYTSSLDGLKAAVERPARSS